MNLCFVDDDADFEIPLFVEMFGGEFDLLTATKFEDCRAGAASRSGWLPDLVVLDMYLPTADVEEDALDRLRREPLSLPPDDGAIRRAWFNCLAARRRLHSVLSAWHQGPEGGIALAGQVHGQWPRAPIVFYTRKATPEDVLRCMRQPGVADVIRKPSGVDDEDTRRRAFEERDAIAGRFRRLAAAAAGEAGVDRLKESVRHVCEDITFFASNPDLHMPPEE